MAVLLRDTNAITDQVVADTPSGGIEKGEVVSVGGSVYGFAFTKASDDPTNTEFYSDLVTIVTQARQAVVDKATGTGAPEFVLGETVYYNLTTGLAVKSGGGAIKIGYAKESADDSKDKVFINFDGTIGV